MANWGAATNQLAHVIAWDRVNLAACPDVTPGMLLAAAMGIELARATLGRARARVVTERAPVADPVESLKPYIPRALRLHAWDRAFHAPCEPVAVRIERSESGRTHGIAGWVRGKSERFLRVSCSDDEGVNVQILLHELAHLAAREHDVDHGPRFRWFFFRALCEWLCGDDPRPLVLSDDEIAHVETELERYVEAVQRAAARAAW